jgi:hypothetical protein
MASYAHTFTSGDTVTPTKLNNARTVSDIVNADIKSDAAIAGSKLADGGVGPTKLTQPLTFETAKATTSGTSIDFTGIPSWVNRITVMLNQVSTNGTDGAILQLGDSGGIEDTGYAGTGTAITGANTCGISSFTAGFSAGTGVLATASRSGVIFLLHAGANTWIASGTVTNGATAAGHTQGVKVLSSTLDRVRLTTTGGTNAFDAGSVNIAYEG